MKVKWKVQPEPTGRYRSFESRGWPFAEDEKERPLAHIYSKENESYCPKDVKTGNHGPLVLHVAKYSDCAHSFTWRRIKAEYKTVQECKDAFAKFVEDHPGYFENKVE